MLFLNNILSPLLIKANISEIIYLAFNVNREFDINECSNTLRSIYSDHLFHWNMLLNIDISNVTQCFLTKVQLLNYNCFFFQLI